MDMSLFLSISNLLGGNSDIKCLKSSLFRFDASLSNFSLQNWSESKNIVFLLIIILIYLSLVFGITCILMLLKLIL